MEEKMYEVENLTIKFEGTTSIDADLLLSSLENIITAYRGTINSCYTGLDYELWFKPFAPGSFEMYLETAKVVVPAIAGYIPNAISCANTFIDLVKLKHELKGKKPKEVDIQGSQVALTTASGDVHYHGCNVYNTYISVPSVDGALSNLFSAVESEHRPAFSVSGRESSVRIPEEDYKYMKEPIIDLEDPEKTTVTNKVHALLPVKTPDFLGNAQWSFIYEGKIIHATIADDTFIEKVRKRQVTFFSGIELPVEMQIEVTLDKNLKPIHYTYIILKVTGDPIESNAYEEQQLALEDIIQQDDE